jgi:hypothetical protein
VKFKRELSCEAAQCSLMEPFSSIEGPHIEAAPMIDSMVQSTVPEDYVHSIVNFNCDFHREALQCDWVEPISEGGGPHTESARMIDGTVEDAVPEDLVYT